MPKRSEKEIRKEQVDDVRAVMQMVGGRRMMLRFMEDVCGIHKSVFRMPPPGSDVTERERLAVNGAKQAVGQWLRAELMACAPVEYERMNLEAETQKAIEAQMADNRKALEKGEEEQNDGE
jgi:hypothetical protein